MTKPAKLPWHRRAIAELYAERVGETKIKETDLYELVEYGHHGFDYDLYREIQSIANKGKLNNVFAVEANIAALCRHLRTMIPAIHFVLCHGVRNGTEQRWFAEYLPAPVEAIGTDISETASQFPNTIQWDFHETKPEWIGAVDVIYSNSWDHAYDPAKMFLAWLSCLRLHGVLAIEWTTGHGRGQADVMDPLGMNLEDLLRFLLCITRREQFAITMIEDDRLPVRNISQTMVLLQRLA